MKKAILAVVLSLVAAFPSLALDYGDPAPAISPALWITGEAADPTQTDDNTIYLVEVWSVTCPPCVKTIPILNDLQKRYADKGFKIISFTTDTEEEVRDFLADHPMEYSSFIDNEGESMIKYMAADNRNTIPHAFLFDKTGALVWIGNPLDNLELRIKQALDGTLNRDQALAVRDARADLQTAFESQNVGGMLKALGQLEKLEPENGQYYQIHYRILTDLDAGDAQEVQELLGTWYEGTKEQAEDLVILSVVAMGKGHPDMRNPVLALTAARKAFSLDSPERMQAGLNLAETYKEIGRIDLSLATLSEMTAFADSEDLSTIAAIENYYRRVQELGQNPDVEYKP